MLERTEPPWSPEQVAALNDFQQLGFVHEFTCGRDGCRAVLVATPEGWVCPADGCGYRQGWAHACMADRSHPIWSNPLGRFEAVGLVWNGERLEAP